MSGLESIVDSINQSKVQGLDKPNTWVYNICLLAVHSPFMIEKNDVTFFFLKCLLFMYSGEFFCG